MIYNIPFSTIPYFSFSHFPFPISQVYQIEKNIIFFIEVGEKIYINSIL